MESTPSKMINMSFATNEPKFNITLQVSPSVHLHPESLAVIDSILVSTLQIRAVSRPKDERISPNRLYGMWSEPVTITVDEYNPPRPAAIETTSISVEVVDPHLDVGANGNIVVVVGVNASWGQPELTFGTLSGYDMWVGIEGDVPSVNEIVSIEVRPLRIRLWFCPMTVHVDFAPRQTGQQGTLSGRLRSTMPHPTNAAYPWRA